MRPHLAVLVTVTLFIVTACDTGLAPGDEGSGAPLGSAAADASAGSSIRHSLVPPTPTPLPTFLVYVVKPADSLLTIAKRLHTTGRSLAYWNRATYKTLDPDSPGYAPDKIQVGWKLRYLPGQTTDGEDELASPDVPGSPDVEASPSESPATGPAGTPAAS
ncbi:MAG: LysM peptidoglycan-binding domain-containing protein [Candidatus Limnocylindrales bacterium]